MAAKCLGDGVCLRVGEIEDDRLGAGVVLDGIGDVKGIDILGSDIEDGDIGRVGDTESAGPGFARDGGITVYNSGPFPGLSGWC